MFMIDCFLISSSIYAQINTLLVHQVRLMITWCPPLLHNGNSVSLYSLHLSMCRPNHSIASEEPQPSAAELMGEKSNDTSFLGHMAQLGTGMYYIFLHTSF